MAIKLSLRPLVHSAGFSFEYALKPEELELEGLRYTGIGVTAKMTDAAGNQYIEHIPDVTTEPQVAQRLIQQLNAFLVSPMCLQLFIEDFLARL